MALKKTDYMVEKGTLKVQFKRPVRINDKTSNLTVEVSLNHKKGLHTITAKWDHDQITHNKQDDTATVKVIGELMMEAKDYALKWRKEWEENQPGGDDDQMDMGFVEGEAATQV